MTGQTGALAPARRTSRSGSVVAWLLDLAVVVAFVLVGRSSHEEGASGFFVTALPFFAAMQTGWLLTSGDRRRIRTGAVIWAATVVIGLVLRLATGDTAAPGFVVVTAIALGAGLLGWRAVAALVQRAVDSRRTRPAA